MFICDDLMFEDVYVELGPGFLLVGRISISTNTQFSRHISTDRIVLGIVNLRPVDPQQIYMSIQRYFVFRCPIDPQQICMSVQCYFVFRFPMTANDN